MFVESTTMYHHLSCQVPKMYEMPNYIISSNDENVTRIIRSIDSASSVIGSYNASQDNTNMQLSRKNSFL